MYGRGNIPPVPLFAGDIAEAREEFVGKAAQERAEAEGVVAHVSPDATVDQQRGLVFPVRIKLTKKTLNVDGRLAILSPGMSATAEVVTGKRRVIDYLWSPVAKALGEAGRER